MDKRSRFLPVCAFLAIFGISVPNALASPREKNLENHTVDTITVVADALVAIDGGVDCYSVNSSCLIDTLIAKGAARCLRAKGYKTHIVAPLLMGSFMDSLLPAPIDKDSIFYTPLPFRYKSNYTAEQLGALHRINRRLYLQSLYAKGVAYPKLPAALCTADLNTLKTCLKSDHVLFILHQAAVVSLGADAASVAGNIAISAVTLVAGGPAAGIFSPVFSKESSFNTYYFLVEFSSGTVKWSSYTSSPAAQPSILRAYAIGGDHQPSLLEDSVYTLVLYQLHNYHLRGFPEHKDNAFVKNRGKAIPYPGMTCYSNNKRQFPSNVSRKIIHQIDSLVEDHCLNETTPHGNAGGNFEGIYGKGRPKDMLERFTPLLNIYFDYAFYSCKRFNPAIDGSFDCEFSITQDGRCKNISISNSTVHDPLIEYCIGYVLRRISFGTADAGVGATLVKTVITFQNRTVRDDVQGSPVTVLFK